MRQCALTKSHLPKTQMIRFVLSPDLLVTPDLRCKLPGRGLWLKADRSTIELAVKKNVFARGFRKKIVVKDDLADKIEEMSRKNALQLLSLANKAGLVITGYEKIRKALAKGHVKWLLHAKEAARNGSDRLDRYFAPALDKAGQEHQKGSKDQDGGENVDQIAPPLPDLFTGEELSLALGRANVIHIGLKHGELARHFVVALQRTLAFTTKTSITKTNMKGASFTKEDRHKGAPRKN